MKDIVEFQDFNKLDLRVGLIVEVVTPKWSEKLLEFKVDFGAEIGQKTILSGVKKWYTPEDFIDKKYIFIVNLAERKMGESVSQGMMLMICPEEDEKPLPIPATDSAPIGSVIQ